MDYNEYKIDSINQSTKKKVIITVIVCFSILLLLTGLFFSVTYINNKNKNINNASVLVSDKENISNDKNFCVICVDDNDEIEFISIIKSQVYNKKFYITMLSPKFVLKSDYGEKSYNQHYLDGGINELLECIKTNEEINLDKYILTTHDNLTMIFGKMGHIVVDITAPVTLNVSEGKVTIEKGRQELDYEEICDYLINGCFDDNKLVFQGNFICTIMKQYLENFDYSTSADVFSELINYVQTDISVVDYTSNQDVISSFEGAEFTFINTLDN